ncbi:MAG: Rieske 2Fe-2S domain-containing protein [Gammaproteobacteria bacterium]|nr:Rieske 2Fe-2S domain-containing protein [Gammaproteobacteria bacterium]
MDKTTQFKILKELFRQLDNNVNVDAGIQLRNPTSSYTCSDLAGKKWKTFFREHPQLIGLSSDLPEPGTYITSEDFGVPVLATRAEDGRFRAFINACRHRGVKVAPEARGESARFQCPFHNWTYSSKGELLGIPRMRDFGALDRACHGLIELPAEERYGLLYVHPQPDGRLNIDELLGELAGEIESWHIGGFIYMGQSAIDKALNWKLANDTFGETYHFPRLHKNTLGQLFYGDALAYETFGRNHRFVFPAKTIDYLREKPEQEWSIARVANVLYYLFPNIQLNIGPRSLSLIRIYPDGENPGRSITRIGHYFSQYDIDAAKEKDRIRIDAGNVYDATSREGKVSFSLEASMEVFDSTVEQEDYAMGETTQRAAASGALQHVIFGRNEPALHHYHNTFREALGMAPLEQAS